ncbi:hypothetical protein BRADI_3g01515v3 [Brachypodium distachyon]|uniref:Uncharacterized protein n=1 Tax=Brachypodium distachyon TaxID=15368 RepID=A0A2K2CUM5_BRADI|nr:hypothetical protein BRADI_3g01515v3 [Brachypodium distachyon]
MEQSPAVPLKKIERERDEARRREPWRREARRVLIACARRSARTRRPRPRRRCGTPPYQDGGFGRPFLDSAGRPTPRPTPINRTAVNTNSSLFLQCKQGNCISPPEVSNDEICCLLLVLKLNLVVHLSVPLSFEQIKFSGGPKITPSNPGKSVLD